MAYTRTWDETFPPDTQAANLLGQDLRNTKGDVRERVASFGAGTLAARPTPEASFAGVTYYATDTNQLFLWSGTAWSVIRTLGSGITKLVDSSVQTITNPAVQVNGNQIFIPANTLTVGAFVEVWARALVSSYTSSSNQSILSLYFGATQLGLNVSFVAGNYIMFNGSVLCTGVSPSSTQTSIVEAVDSAIGAPLMFIAASPTEDTSSAISIRTVVNQAGTFSVTCDMLVAAIYLP